MEDKNFNIYNVQGAELMGNFPHTPYISPTSGKIPIIGFEPIPARLAELVMDHPDLYDKELLRVMNAVYNCGCNSIITGGQFSQIDATLKAVDDLALGKVVNDPLLSDVSDNAGTSNLILPPSGFGGPVLGVFINSDALHTNITDAVEIISKYRENKYIRGWQVFDRPTHFDWGNVIPDDYEPREYNRLTCAFKTACIYCKSHKESIDKEEFFVADQLTWFNLIGSEEPLYIGSCKNYQKYLWGLDQLFKPAVWSFAYYPFVQKGWSEDGVAVIDSNYAQFIKYLKLVSYQSNASQRPFWSWCNSEGYMKVNNATGETSIWYPAPQFGMLRYTAFAALAYGAKGIVYSRIGEKSLSKPTTHYLTNINVPVTAKVSQSETGESVTLIYSDSYFILKKLNKEIENASRAFLDTKCIRVMHRGIGQEITDILPFGRFKDVTTEGNGVQLSILHGNGKSYQVIVNQDAFNNQTIGVRLDVTGKTNWEYISPLGDNSTSNLNSNLGPDAADGEMRVIQLPPGGIAIFEWNI